MHERRTLINAEVWLRKLTGTVPQTSTGWFRAGVGFYRKRFHNPAVTCLEKAVAMDEIFASFFFFSVLL